MACEEQVHELPNALSPLGCGLNGLDTLLLSINVEKDLQLQNIFILFTALSHMYSAVMFNRLSENFIIL